MDFLLDTHAFLWHVEGNNRLSPKAKTCIEDAEALKYISIASFWEIAIKQVIGKLDFDVSLFDLKDHVWNHGFEILPITFEHISTLTLLRLFHKDPFDRMIIAQAISENLTIIGKDNHFSHYNIPLMW